MCHLPHELGDIPQLSILGIENCPKITHLPWTISRLPENLCIDLSNMNELLKNMGLAKEAKLFGPPFFTVCPREVYFLDKRTKFYNGLFWLAVHFGRARKRAIDRLYAPGGIRYEQTKQSFQSAMNSW